MLQECPECGRRISSSTRQCPGCGAQIVWKGGYFRPASSEGGEQPQGKSFLENLQAGCFLVLLILGILAYLATKH